MASMATDAAEQELRGSPCAPSGAGAHPKRCAPMVQHGSLRQSREAGRLPQACSASPEIALRQFAWQRDRRRLEDLALAKKTRDATHFKTALLRYIRVPCWLRRN